MYSTAIHFRAYHHTFSLTQKHVPVVGNFVPIITLSVQHRNVYYCYTFSCLSSRFQSNTEMYSSSIHFRASCVIKLVSPFQFNTEMYSTAIHSRAYHHAFSLTRKCILVVRNLCLPSHFQSYTEMYTTGYIFVLAVSSRGLMSVVRSLLKLYAILVIPALPRLAQILPPVKQW